MTGGPLIVSAQQTVEPILQFTILVKKQAGPQISLPVPVARS